jgi:hypothetical protein
MSTSDFDNETVWRWRLHSLSFTNPVNDTMPKDYEYDGWARSLIVEIGKTGCADQNIVEGSLSNITANQYKLRQKYGGVCMGVDMRLPSPYKLPRDTGFEVKVQNLHKDYPILVPPTIIFRGRREDGEPIILAGEGSRPNAAGIAIAPNTVQAIKSADLFNKGRREVWIDRIILKDIDAYYHLEEPAVAARSTKGTWIGWMINPTTGTQWMPVDQPIPVGNLAPMGWRNPPNTLTFTNLGPRSYYFPPLTYLYPRQRLGIRWGNTLTSPLGVHVCLQVEMEVE